MLNFTEALLEQVSFWWDLFVFLSVCDSPAEKVFLLQQKSKQYKAVMTLLCRKIRWSLWQSETMKEPLNNNSYLLSC